MFIIAYKVQKSAFRKRAHKKTTAIAVVWTGDKGTRTPDLLNAIQTRSQLRHTPVLHDL